MTDAPNCPRCGGQVRPPDLMISAWRCPTCGPVAPLHVAGHLGNEVVESISTRAGGGEHPVPVWCPWPLPTGWLVTGVGWAGDEATGAHATALACSGPSPLHGGPADMLIVAEEPGVGLGNRFAGLTGPDPGAAFAEGTRGTAHAKVKAGGRDTPMWSVCGPADRVAYVGEARGMWLYAVAWPPDAGYLLSDHIALHDLTEWIPAELVYGAPSPYLHA